MDAIRVMEHKRDAHVAELKALLAKVKAEGRPLTPEERVKADDVARACEVLDGEIKAEHAAVEYDRHFAKAIDSGGPLTTPRKLVGEPGSARYADLFGAPAASEHFPDAESFYAALASGRSHPGLRPMATMTEGLGSAGGFLVPEELVAESLDGAVEESVFLPRCRIFPMTSDTKSVAGIEANGSGTYGPYGTWEPTWVGEGGSIGESDPTVRKVSLVAKKLALYIKVSNELLADGLSFSQQLGGAMRKALGWGLDYAIAQGNGVGRPLGVVAAPATVVVSKEVAQVAATVVADNITKMYARLLPSAYAGAAWYISPTVRPQLYKLSIPIGVGGVAYVGTPLLQVNGTELSLLGLPVHSTEKLPVLGTKGDIMLANMAYYGLGLRKEVSIESSGHIGFQTDTVAFRGIVRCAGLPLLAAAYTPKAGDSLSAFVVLETR